MKIINFILKLFINLFSTLTALQERKGGVYLGMRQQLGDRREEEEAVISGLRSTPKMGSISFTERERESKNVAQFKVQFYLPPLIFLSF